MFGTDKKDGPLFELRAFSKSLNETRLAYYSETFLQQQKIQCSFIIRKRLIF